MIDKKLLDVLVCPKSKKRLILIGQELVCIESKLAYPINDGIPILLVKEARELTSEEISNIN
tara:strand:+ start:169 stop:354 length:186 start_codon:yes stop_codon:yes gene_type:complete